LSDASHNQIEVNAFYPFGRVQTASPQAGFKVSRQFTGQIKDDETGLYYYVKRYYDPELGRFTQPNFVIQDLSNPQSYNRYSYCGNNPLRYTDPTGLDFIATTADLRYGYIPGPNAYKTGNSTIGKIGASVYNIAPLVANATYQGMRGLAAADRAAGDVLHATTLAVTRDPQLAENSRGLTLFIGGVGELGKVAKVGEAVSLEQRAQELHSVLDPIAQRMRTTAVTATEEGVTYVSSSLNELSKAQKAALKPGEVAAAGAGHAEVTGINAAKQAGHTPTATAASRPICPTCAQTLQEQGVKPASPLKKTD
jgi:RHS repeat-associated protein